MVHEQWSIEGGTVRLTTNLESIIEIF